MKNEMGKLFGVAVSSAVLASLCTWTIGFGLTSALGDSQPNTLQPDNDALLDLKAQISSLLTPTPDGKGAGVFSDAVLKSEFTADYLAQGMSEAYVANNVSHASGLTKVIPYASHVYSFSLSDAALKDLPVQSAQVWDMSNFRMDFYSANSDTTVYPLVPLPFRFHYGPGYPYQGSLSLQIEALNGVKLSPASCAGEYSDEMNMVAAIFKDQYLPEGNADELCQYIQTSEKITGNINGETVKYTSYTLNYPTDLPTDKQTGSRPLLPTIIRPTDSTYLGETGYTLATWSTPYGTDATMKAKVAQLSSDFTSYTVMNQCGDYGGCY